MVFICSSTLLLLPLTTVTFGRLSEATLGRSKTSHLWRLKNHQTTINTTCSGKSTSAARTSRRKRQSMTITKMRSPPCRVVALKRSNTSRSCSKIRAAASSLSKRKEETRVLGATLQLKRPQTTLSSSPKARQPRWGTSRLPLISSRMLSHLQITTRRAALVGKTTTRSPRPKSPARWIRRCMAWWLPKAVDRIIQ